MASIELSKTNLLHNLDLLAQKVGAMSRIAAVLKDNAYGHGLELVAPMCVEAGVRKAVVRTTAEAQKILEYFDEVLILCDRAVAHPKLRFALNDLRDIAQAEAGSRVDLKIDTGMHRNGIMFEQIAQAKEAIAKQGLALVGVMTHYRSADELGSAYAWQKRRFEEVKARFADKEVQFHSHNSAALLRCDAFDEDFARVGIALYGYNELPMCFGHFDLRPVMRLCAKRIATRRLRKGERIGYGGDFVAPCDMTVSTYDIGYGDGWRRGDSADAYVTAEGLPILGRVSMDMIVLEGDKERVCIFDDAQKPARHYGTISYEITTALSKEIERKIVS